jgi:hypothetical protein
MAKTPAAWLRGSNFEQAGFACRGPDKADGAVPQVPVACLYNRNYRQIGSQAQVLGANRALVSRRRAFGFPARPSPDLSLGRARPSSALNTP